MFTQITASAGAGKTYTLTQLFLQHLRSAGFTTPSGGCALSSPTGEYGLSEILAATFTNKAASEMKDRVILALKENALGPWTEPEKTARESSQPSSKGPSLHCSHTPPATKKNQYERWLLAIFKQSSLLNIRTIDSLLFLLVRLSALELALPPEITPSFDSEEYYTPLYDALMTDIAAYNNNRAFLDNEEDAARYEGFSQDLEQYYKALVTYAKHDGFSLKNKLHDDLFRLVQRLLVQAEVPAVTGETLHATINTLHANLLNSCDVMQEYIVKEELTVDKNLEKSIIKAQASSPYDKLTNNKITQPGSREPAAIVTQKSLHTPSDKAQKAYVQLCHDYELFTSKIPLLLGALPLVPLIPLAQELYKRVFQTALQTNVLPAELIPAFASQVLRGDYGVSDTLCRLGNRLHHILLDEFQDTSVEQWGAIEPLVIECLSKGGTFTYVGDVKQAIYSWRKGEIRLFDGILDVARNLHREPSIKSLDNNWRSSPAIIDFNNAFFSLLHNPAIAKRTLRAMLPPQTPEHILEETRQRLCGIYAHVKQTLPPESLRPPYVNQGKVHLYEVKGKNAEQLSSRIQKRLLALVPDLLNTWKYEDITILTRSGDESAQVAAWLTNENIPVITENSFMLADNPLVSRLMALLAFVDYPYDDLALWEFLTGEECFGAVSGLSRKTLDMWLAQKRQESAPRHGPIFQLFQKHFPELWEKWLAPFHNRAGLMTAYDMLHEGMRLFQLFERRPSDAPFLTRLLELAHYAETQGISSLAGFLQFWEKARDHEKLPSPPHMPAITIMTMHKAKGLEFPVVILPFQHGGRGFDDSLVVDETLGFPLLTKISKFTSEPYFDKEATNAIECLNLLYVAWTRPRYELHSFITSHGRPAMLGKGLEVLLEEFLDLPFTGYIYEESLPLDEETIENEGNAEELPLDVSRPADLTDGELPCLKTPPLADGATSHDGALQTKEEPALSVSLESAHSSTASALQPPFNHQAEPHPLSPQHNYLMEWLPELKIYRTNLDNLSFTASQRGDLFHYCLEHLHLPSHTPRNATLPDGEASGKASNAPSPNEILPSNISPAEPPTHSDFSSGAVSIQENIATAIALGFQKLPFVLTETQELTQEITTALNWFASLPQAPHWLKNGLREQSLLGDDNQLYRVDLLVVDEDSLHAIDYKTGSMAGHKGNLQQVQAYMKLLSLATCKKVHGTLVYLDLQELVEVSL